MQEYGIYMKGCGKESEWGRAHGDWKLHRVTCILLIGTENTQ